MTFTIGEIVSALSDDHAAGVLGVQGPEGPQPTMGSCRKLFKCEHRVKVKVSLLVEHRDRPWATPQTEHPSFNAMCFLY